MPQWEWLSCLVPRPVPRGRADPLDAGLHPAAVVLLQFHPARLLPRHRRRLPARARAGAPVHLVPAVQAVVIAAVYFFRLEVAVATSGSIYFSSGTTRRGRAGREHAAAAAALRHRRRCCSSALAAADGERDVARCRRCAATRSTCSAAWPASSRSACCSWLELSPTVWFGVAFAAAVPLSSWREPGSPRCDPRKRPSTTAHWPCSSSRLRSST